MKIPFAQPTLPRFEEIESSLRKIISSGMLTKGNYLAEYEEKMAQYLQVKYVIAVSSGTTGLLLAEQSLNLKGEVILPSFTFSATAHSLIWNNLTPVFVDCERESFNIDPKCVEKAITLKTSAIIAVHVFGNPCNIEKLVEIAKEYNIKLIFDAAHGLGSFYRGEPLGKFGDVSIFSTSPTKLLTTGEGGLVATNNKELAKKIMAGREYGSFNGYDCLFPGLNGRLGEMNAVLGIKGLGNLNENSKKRNKMATLYKIELGKLFGISFPRVNPNGYSSYKDFSIVIEPEKFGSTRDDLAMFLEKEGIATKKYFYPPVHQQQAYQKHFSLPVTEYLSANILCLPMFSHIKEPIVRQICKRIKCL